MRSRAELLLDALKVCTDQYSNYSSRYAALDGKAQGTATLGGVLLGAVLAFVPQTIFRATLKFYGATATYPVAGALVLSICGIVFALRSMGVKAGRIPFQGEAVGGAVLDLLQLSDVDRTNNLIERHYAGQLQQWRLTLEDMRFTINRKSVALRSGQMFIAGAAASVAAFVMLVLLSLLSSTG
jgi:hypothetical protein